MPILRLAGSDLARGLRPSARAARNTVFLVESVGMVGRDGVLSAIDELSRLSTSDITDTFPFPQIFVCTHVILICGRVKIYELVSGSLSEKIEATVGGGRWCCMDFDDYIYLSNGEVAIIRSTTDKSYSETSDLPTATGALNYNGQMMITAPDVSGLAANLVAIASPITVTTTLHGTGSTS